jgi:kinesin family protein C2/C3
LCAPAGYNVCIFAYGQTGSGKTHTMSGTDTMHLEGRGINYRALDDLFSIRDRRDDEVRGHSASQAAMKLCT